MKKCAFLFAGYKPDVETCSNYKKCQHHCEPSDLTVSCSCNWGTRIWRDGLHCIPGNLKEDLVQW